jgi:hypothetical protein
MSTFKRPNEAINFVASTRSFPDGTLFELVRTANSEIFNLLSWRGKVLKVSDQIQRHGERYAPIQIDPCVSRVLRLPRGVAPPEKTQDLFNATHSLFSRHLDQPECCITQLVAIVFASWLFDRLPMAPLLWIVASRATSAFATLQLLNLVCRRPLLLVGINRGDMRSLPLCLQPTLLLNEPNLSSAMQRILISSTREGINFPSSHGFLNLFGPKIVCSRSFPSDSQLQSDALQIVLVPTARDITYLDAKLREEIANENQDRFFGYRLRNFNNVQVRDLDAGCRLTPPMRELARSLGGAIVGDEELQQRVVSTFASQDEQFRAERANSTDAVLIEILLDSSHEIGRRNLRSCELAQRVNALHGGRASEQMISAETAGWKMKSLGLATGRIDSAGNGLELTESARRLIHQLAATYEVLSLQSAGFAPECKLCNEIRAQLARRKKS